MYVMFFCFSTVDFEQYPQANFDFVLPVSAEQVFGFRQKGS